MKAHAIVMRAYGSPEVLHWEEIELPPLARRKCGCAPWQLR